MSRQVIALFTPGSTINLGIGMPTGIAELIPKAADVHIHSENGVLGVSGRPLPGQASPTLINAGKETIAVQAGASFFDSATSFGMIRGGHIDFAILGGMEVDVEGNLANWMVPGKKVTGMGGAMDLVHGARQVIVMMTHLSRSGEAKMVRKCALPLTGLQVVDLVVTDLGRFEPTGKRFRIVELASGVKRADLRIHPELLEEGT
jgi:3-oxoacid CoA-transferase subunit B